RARRDRDALRRAAFRFRFRFRLGREAGAPSTDDHEPVDRPVLMRRSFAIAVTLLALSRSAAAEERAEPSAADIATARVALTEGVRLREKGELLQALGRIQTAFDLVPSPVTGFELGKTHMMLGHV